MSYDAKTPRDQLLLAAQAIATRTLHDVTMRDPQAPVTQLYFVALDAGSPNGRVAAACLLVNQGSTMDSAMRQVSAQVDAGRRAGTLPMLGTMVKADGLRVLLGAGGMEPGAIDALQSQVDEGRTREELAVVVISSDIFTTTVKGSDKTSVERWN